MHSSGNPGQDSAVQPLLDAVRCAQQLAKRARQRRLVQIAGARDWCTRTAVAVLNSLEFRSVHWFGDPPPADAVCSHGAPAARLLGSELDALVFDAWAGFDPDAFGALAGTVRAGGLLLLLTPRPADWPHMADPQNARITVEPHPPESLSARYIRRLIKVLDDDPDVVLCEQSQPTHVSAPGVVEPLSQQSAAIAPCRTHDQQRAVEAVCHVATGHRRRPVVLTADRGRGKSAAFGIAAAQLIRQGRQRILVTGPGLASVQAVLDHARALLPEADHQAIAFVAPDALVQAPQPADLVLVDEAAALPAPLLLALLQRYPRIAFSTTVHGYEGSGRGFALRFTRMLDVHSNSWKTVQLLEPIRWASGDPLERLTFRMLLLDAGAAVDQTFSGLQAAQFIFESVDREQLLHDERSLNELFGLLVLAHYRTRPLDLRHLLDGPNLSVYALRAHGHIAATALVAQEGGFEASRCAAICAGTRRPRGHLLPETLAAQQGLHAALQLQAARVIRIAVHPAVQRRGLGKRLLHGVVAAAERAGCDYLGSSFGATPELLHFWRAVGAQPVRVGFQRGASSGCHSVVMLHPLSAAGTALQRQARERYLANFPHQLADSLRDLDAELVVDLLSQTGALSARPDPADWQEVRGIAHQQRMPESAAGALWRVVCFALMDATQLAGLSPDEVRLLVARVLQKHDWSHCAALLGVTGRGAALALLRRAVARLIGYYCAGDQNDGDRQG